MTPEEEKKLLEKLDAMTKRLVELEKEPVVVEDDNKEDVDPLIAKAAEALRKTLVGSFTKEKLDTMSLDEILMASALKEDFKPPIGIIPPTGGGTPKQDALDGVPDSFKAHFGSEEKYGELIK